MVSHKHGFFFLIALDVCWFYYFLPKKIALGQEIVRTRMVLTSPLGF